MTPGARIAAAIEIVADVLEKGRAADRALAEWGRAHRYAGSKDRRAVADWVYTIFRRRNECAWIMGDEGPRALALGAMRLSGMNADEIGTVLTDGAHAAGALSEDERDRIFPPPSCPPKPEGRRGITGEVSQSEGGGSIAQDPPIPAHTRGTSPVNGGRKAPRPVRLNYPEWMEAELEASLGETLEAEMMAAIERAPPGLRVNPLRSDIVSVETALSALGMKLRRSARAPFALIVEEGDASQLQRHELFSNGAYEMQDEGSQIASALLEPKPGETILDLCAGAGGKALYAAAAMKGQGRIIACDVDAPRLANILPRGERAGVADIIEVWGDPYAAQGKLRALNPDAIIVDAPCSGSGTWRRNPEAKWTLTPERLGEYRAAQRQALELAAGIARPASRILYITCSLLRSEGEDQVQAFVNANAGWRTLRTLRLSPARDGTDGFYAAVLVRAQS
jgi:16S rRNA (cytosine967-C5)-methyltransferase